jgi:hypothetical protein
MENGIGQGFANAIAAKDRATLLKLLDPEVDFRGMTPGRFWETASAVELVDDFMLGTWFGPDDHIEALEDVQSGAVADRDRVAYRMRIRRDGSPHVVEQQAYYGVEDGRIAWLRIMCCGYRPID